MNNQLASLKKNTTVVVDTSDFFQLSRYKPQDATTNPSLILKSVQKAEYFPLLKEVVDRFRTSSADEVVDRLLVRFGCEILKQVPGRVSTEVDARLSFDTVGTVGRAKRLVDLYGAEGVGIDRLLIKMASTWEGIKAAEQLEKMGIHTNLTLLFSQCQAIACGQAKVQLVSPFVGRIYDWYKKTAGSTWDESISSGVNDPGVRSVHKIFNYYKHFDIPTEVMGASFRNIGQIQALVGCDLLTISPNLLAELSTNTDPLVVHLNAAYAKKMDMKELSYDEASFRLALNEDTMGTENLAEGIRGFCIDSRTLDRMILEL